MPETSDSDFFWDDFVQRNNGELVAVWGNLAHRVLSFTHLHFGEVLSAVNCQKSIRSFWARTEGCVLMPWVSISVRVVSAPDCLRRLGSLARRTVILR